MKKFISLFILITIVLSAFASCGLKEKEAERAKREKYEQALSLIEAGEYVAAFDALTELGEYENAKEMLGNFTYVLDRSTGGYYTEDGVYNENNVTEMTYNSDGLLISLVRSDEKFEFTYDENKRLIRQTQTNESGTWVNNEYEYDEKGNLIKKTDYSSNLPLYQWEYTYDERGNMTRKIERYSKHLEISSLDLRYILDYTYDEMGNMIESVVEYESGSKSRRCYVYDENGRLIREEIPGEHDSETVVQYFYDERGNLIREAYSTTAVVWIYDENGRLTKKVECVGYNFTANNVIYTTDYTYDESGRLIREEGYDPGNHRITTEYTYGESGNLVKKYKETREGIDYNYTYIYDEHGNTLEYISERVGGLTYVSKHTYKLIYLPYELHEVVEDLVHPEYP